MKVNLQKIIALIAVLAVTVSILNIPVSALLEADYMYVVGREIYDDITELMESHRNGDITVSEVLSGLATIQGNAILSGFDYEANKIDRLINGIQRSNGGSEHGGGGSGGSRSPISDIWNDICNKHNVPTETTQTSKTDMRGFGARLDEYVGGKLFNSKYGDYIIVKRFASNGSYIYSVTIYPQRASYTYPDNPYGWIPGYYENYVNNSGASGLSEDDLSKFKWYGDVRYEGFDEGEEPPSNDEFEYGTIRKYDEMNDKEINDLLNDFAEEMERENPDLSSIEGLLNAIYARLGTLDSDNDNQLLSQILVAIKALENKKEDNSELLALLNDIKNSLVFGDDDDKKSLAEQLKEFTENMPAFGNIEINEDSYNNRLEVLKNRILGKFSFIYNMKNFVENCFEQYSSTENIPEISFTYCGKQYNVDFSFFNEHIVLVQWLIAGFVYASYAYHTYRKIPSYINGGDNE